MSSEKKLSKKIISRNESNNITGVSNMSSYMSIYSLSHYDKSLRKATSVKKNLINKNLLLKNFSQYRNKSKNKFHLLVGNSH